MSPVAATTALATSTMIESTYSEYPSIQASTKATPSSWQPSRATAKGHNMSLATTLEDPKKWSRNTHCLSSDGAYAAGNLLALARDNRVSCKG